MAISISNAAAMASVVAFTSLVDVGTPASTLKIYGGAVPAQADTALGAQTLLVNFALAAPSFAAPVDLNPGAHATANAVTAVQAAATGTATFFRMFDGNGLCVMQGSVSDTAGTGDLKLSSTAIIQGIDVTVVSLTVTQPES